MILCLIWQMLQKYSCESVFTIFIQRYLKYKGYSDKLQGAASMNV